MSFPDFGATLMVASKGFIATTRSIIAGQPSIIPRILAG
jgi:hypothetical protein